MTNRFQQWKEEVVEMEIVLDNYTTILEKAVTLDPDYGTAYAKQLLYTIFEMYMPLIEAELDNCRGHLHWVTFKMVDTKIDDLKTKYGTRDAGQWTEQDFISPIVLLLKLANDEGNISFDREQNDWGRLWSIRQYLSLLNLKEHRAEEERYWPGIPSCILSVVPVWTSHQIVISASNDRFLVTNALNLQGRAFRNARLSEMQASCTDAVRHKVADFMSSSNSFKQEYKASEAVLQKNGYIKEDQIAAFKQASGLMRIHLPGIVVSWSPPGTYKPACLLDYCRFHMLRPPKAEELEQKGWWKIKITNEAGVFIRMMRVTDKMVWDTDSCAEWAAFLELAKVSTATVTEATQW
jgi:hypothetical protein